jgi:adenylate cyclase class IV
VQVSVRILGGLMALGYEIGTMLKRSSAVYSDEQITIKLDDIEGMDRQYVQIQGKDRNAVAAAGRALGLEGTYIARSYIEQVPISLALHPTVQRVLSMPIRHACLLRV